MFESLSNLNHISQALIATLFTWFMTALGAALVFTTKSINRKVLDSLLGFAGGIMIAASWTSLLSPAIEMSKGMKIPVWIPPASGFLLGGIFLWGVDKILPHLHIGFPMVEAEGIKTSWHRSILLVFAITLHNIPEGLAVGFAFGSLGLNIEGASFTGAVALSIGIGIQNFPEGLAVAMPLRREGMSRWKSFWYGQLSGFFEPIAAIVGATFVLLARNLLPYALSFAAGAMIFVVVEEVIPESQRETTSDLSTMSLMLGFVIMLILDLAFS